MISVGDRIPSVTLKHLGADGMQDVSTDTLFKGKKIVMFGVPGAFTPTCSNKHLPGFVEKRDALRSKGVDQVVCVAVNDPFVMKAWEDFVKSGDRVFMLADGNGELTEKLGLTMDGSASGLGKRCRRFALVAVDGKVTALQAEAGGGLTCSTADDVLKLL